MRPTTAAALAAAMLAVLAAGLAGCSGDNEPEPAAATMPDGHLLFRFDEFKAAPLVDGGEVTLDSLWGKVVLLDLFGTWCPPCRKSTPVIVSLYERYRGRGFEVIGLAYEESANPEQARQAVDAFRKEFGIPYRLTLGPDVVWKELQAKAGIRAGVPVILLLDRQGVVRDLFEGLPPGREQVLADRIERLLDEPAVPKAGQ